jgi:hypothetical protein
MQENNTNITIVADKVKAFNGKLGLWVRKLYEKSLATFSHLKGIVQENSVEKTDAGTDQSISSQVFS